MLKIAYLSLGSNLGNREVSLRKAIEELGKLSEILKVSSFYETEPVEFLEQPWFLNCAIEIQTALSPRQLLDASLKIEQSMGRKRTHPKGPRIIDIDLLLYGDQVVNEPGLVIPHPAMHERRFVLEPLAEIAPEIPHPVINESVSRILAALPITRPVVRRLPARE